MAAITFTDANGKTVTATSALTVGTGVYLDATLLNDSKLLGVNWSVSCGSALPAGTPLPPGETVDQSCGFFSPVHTATAPVPSYASSGAGVVTFFQAPAAQPKGGAVTVYASPTADPSQSASVTFSILP